MGWLSGKKTYLIAGGVAVLTFARQIGWVDDATFTSLLGFLNAAGLATLRAGVTKSGQ